MYAKVESLIRAASYKKTLKNFRVCVRVYVRAVIVLAVVVPASSPNSNTSQNGVILITTTTTSPSPSPSSLTHCIPSQNGALRGHLSKCITPTYNHAGYNCQYPFLCATQSHHRPLIEDSLSAGQDSAHMRKQKGGLRGG